ncbi:MAG: hypothetical protein CSA20_06600 [Deltaproteobacteria bacterium]|nr:MAG: hypothetical protein CSA20_06600 [Deltaproteobacteria bacterium]
MDDKLKYFVEEYKKERFLLNNETLTSRFFDGVHLEMDRNTGQGWSEILCIRDGLYVEIADYQLNRRLETCHSDTKNLFQLTLLLSGDIDFLLPGKARQSFAAGDIWLSHGPFEQVLCSQHPDREIRGVSIGLPPSFVDSWLGTSYCAASKGLERMAPRQLGFGPSGRQTTLLARGLRQSSQCIRLAKKLISTKRTTLADNLYFESLALDLLSRLLVLEIVEENPQMKRTGKVTAAVDEAVDILRREWTDPPSISSLSRRVGLNECYLKRGFREKTGISIGAYIRQQRMTKALELIETGQYSVLTTAVFVGYSNPSHFSAAFKKFYGHLPSYYLPRSEKRS